MSIKTKALLIMTIIVFALIVTITITSILLWSGVLSKKLPTDQAFRILQITDTHLKSEREDKAVFKTIDMMIKASNPDYIIVTGDITSNQDNEKDIRKFAQVMERYKIEWTFTFGNHDAEGDWQKSEISDFLETLEYCSYQKGFTVKKYGYYSHDSIGNYYKNITDKNGNVLMSLFIMDSNMYYDSPDKDIKGYANFYQEQVDWYKDSVREIAQEVNGDYSKVVPSIAFFHIPMQEYDVAYREGNRLNGGKNEKVYSSKVEDQMFETMVDMKSTKATFVGHDHMNSYTSEYKGIKLSYSYSSDHRLYFVPQRGGNVINITSDGKFTINGIYRNLGIGKLIVTKEF